MGYQYICDTCHIHYEISKPMSASGRPEYCNCGNKLTRRYTCNYVTSEAMYDNTNDIARGMAGKPYRGKYFREDEDSNMG